MRPPHPLLIVLAGLTTLAGCHRADSLASGQRDLKGENYADRAADRADQRGATAAYTEAVTDAEASHRIAVAQCQSLAGDAQKACQTNADVTLARAKAYAQASLAHRD